MALLDFLQLGFQIDWRGILIMALIFVPIEQLLPQHKDQDTLRKGWLNPAYSSKSDRSGCVRLKVL